MVRREPPLPASDRSSPNRRRIDLDFVTALAEIDRFDHAEVFCLSERGTVGVALAGEEKVARGAIADLPAGDHGRLIRLQHPLRCAAGVGVFGVDRVQAIDRKGDGDAIGGGIGQSQAVARSADCFDVDGAAVKVLRARRVIDQNVDGESGSVRRKD